MKNLCTVCSLSTYDLSLLRVVENRDRDRGRDRDRNRNRNRERSLQ